MEKEFLDYSGLAFYNSLIHQEIDIFNSQFRDSVLLKKPQELTTKEKTEEQFTTVLTADEDYSLPATINIDMDNVRLTAGTDYTYNQITGEVVVLGTGGTGGVTGDVVIGANGIEIL